MADSSDNERTEEHAHRTVLAIGLALSGPLGCVDAVTFSPEPVSQAQSALNGQTDAITLTTESQLEPRRQALRNVIWGSTTLPTLQASVHPLTSNCSVPAFANVSLTQELRIAAPPGPSQTTLRIKSEGLACLFVAQAPNGRLVLYNPGHANTVNDSSDWTSDSSGGYGDHRAIQALLWDGYSVVLTFMPGCRPDDEATQWSGSGCTVPHTYMFANWQPPSGSVWQWFLDPVLGALNYVQNHEGSGGIPVYGEFDMLGLSGGGWTTTVYAAIDTRIKTSIPVAGSEPFDFWPATEAENAEQTRPGLYNGVQATAAYRDLYILGAAGAGRRQIQVLNRRDGCCFHPGWGSIPASSWQSSLRVYEQAVRNTLVNMGDTGIFRLEIDDASVQHQISRNAMASVVLPELEGGREHVGAASATDAFVRGGNGDMWHWSGQWEDTGIAIVGTPAVVLNGQHALDVFYRDPGNNIAQAWKNGSSWTSSALGGVIISDPAAVSWAAGRWDVVAFGKSYHLYHWSSAQQGFDLPVASLTGVGTPTMVSAGSNSFDAVFRDLTVPIASSNAGVSRLYWNGSWGSDSLGGFIIGLPSAAVTPGPVRRVYALGMDQRLWEQANLGSGWSGWARISDFAGASSIQLAGSPHAVIRASDSVVVVYVRRFSDNNLALFSLPNSWSVTFSAPPFEGSPTAVPSGGAWFGGLASTLQFFDGTSCGCYFFDMGGVIE